MRCDDENNRLLLPDATDEAKPGYEEQRRKRVLISFDAPNDLDSPAHPYRSLSFTQSQFDLNILVAHINFILEQRCERLVFDGLSEWITMFDKPEAARVLEALMITVKRCDESHTPPTVFMTYEMPLGDDPLGPSALGTTADNIIVVRPVAVNDRFRKVIYALKYDGKAPRDADHANAKETEGLPLPDHPGELVWRKGNEYNEGRLVVDLHSMESYTGLLNSRGEVGPARVLLQLFSENDHEELQNQQQVRTIKDQFKKRLEFTVTNFGISDIGSTLETALSVGKPGEHFNLSIHSVDEWWLRSMKVRAFLRNLKPAAAAEVQPDKPRLRHEDFWWFEVEKAKGAPWENAGDAEYYAMPGYLDFGMLCVNIKSLSKKVIDELLEQVRVPADEGRPPSKDPSSRLVWQRLLHRVPRHWVKRAGEWFSVNAGQISEADWSLLEFALVASGQEARSIMGRKAVFTFDSSTRETCSCMLLELAWAFGGSETLLGEWEAEKSDENFDAIGTALRFLQFMVLEGLMLARCTTNSANHGGQPILFSRRWYSSLRGNRERVRSDAGELRDEEKAGKFDRELEALDLLALPFMPSGFSDPALMVEDLLRDISVRQIHWRDRANEFIREYKLDERLKECSENLCKACVELQAVMKPSGPALLEKVNLALSAYRQSRCFLLKAATIVTDNPGLWAPSLDDLMELAAWASIRLQFVLGAAGGRFPSSLKGSLEQPRPPAGDGLYNGRWIRHNLPDLGNIETYDPANAVGTGYVCTGAWMYGVGANSRSATIQTQVLSELTSLKGSIQRAKFGAGIPARKDFFYLHGEQAVTGMDYMNWRELLRFGGARARRRDRVFLEPPSISGAESSVRPSPILADPSRLYNVIHHEMLACLRIADLYRDDYSAGGAAQTAAIAAVSARTREAVNAIVKTIPKRGEPQAAA